ncbi:2-hydroxyacyl-CoA dehydratase family protein [Geobacter pickeringii]|uniref:2-hydroxyglutaryl-CoA dehydratase n=1 Tax=Geobacter pickeringii TaxID=345632 RepID=A0A0B5B7F9_9BACT|nr:2-hydroxyacyl-CoA dehydratase [Geobacter pickeringii]AJE02463.1 2-hydroxyglutaryl-CoA dehydratase [Geobacter pickeringii]
MHRVGFTTTIPLEVILAAEKSPVDLNNVFITSPANNRMIEEAEVDGFPRSICSWIKGIYAAILECGIKEIVAVTEGDCSNTRALMEVLSLRGVETVPFAYPHDRDPASVRFEIEKLMRHFGVGWDAVNLTRERLGRIRRKVREIDRLTWEENLVSGQENHYFQVCTSDMNGDPDRFEAEVESFLAGVQERTPFNDTVRLAFIGVPPIFDDLYPFIESLGARVVFNETQRQFAMPYDTPDLVEQYRAYTYPYDIFHRLSDILLELERRGVDAVIHYVQSFCFRQIEDMIVRQKIPLPVLTLEGDKPAPLDARTKIRIEGFLEMLAD